MFQLYTGNRLEDLATLLAKALALSPPSNPFDNEYILVQTPGMAQWLKMFVAQSHSIAAGLDFPLPSSFVWRTFSQTLEDIPSQSEFNKPFMVWRLMRLLNARLGQEEFAPLRWYLANDDSQMRRFQLCSAIADIYDQYLVYRPDWIQAWESGQVDDPRLQALFEQQPWQAILWQDLVADVSERGGSLYHRGNLIEALQEATRSKSKPAALPERIFIFGVSSLPPNTLESLRVLASSGWIDVHLFLQNPCRFYWGDVVDKHYLGRIIKRQSEKPGLDIDKLHLDANPLLASWGRLGRDYICQLQEVADSEVEVFDDYCNQGSENSLLSTIQQDVLSLENHGSNEERTAHLADASYRHVIRNHDQSLRLHICHSPLREVEVLHDQLLDLFHSKADLTPKDVIVMLPDVNAYSPFIRAVFSQAQGNKHIPFALIDQSGGMEDPLVDAYLYLMAMAESRFSLSELISVLEVPAVLARFELTPDELERIRQWSVEVGIRWGLSEQTAKLHELPAQHAHTWLNGMRRMLLGYAMGHDYIWQDTLSYGDVEGLDASIAGKLAQFLAQIEKTQKHLLQQQVPSDWLKTLHELAKTFFDQQLADGFLTLLKDQLEVLAQQWGQAYFDDPIEHSVVRQMLAPMLQESQGSQRFLAGKVNFCSLMPMRSVPFKVICVLGLNEGDYPRNVMPMGFDLMVGDYRSGDRSRREDDKYLFLEALMSARECFYLSYVGKNIQDNGEKNPSILVNELLEYASQSCVFEKHANLPPEQAQQALLQAITVEHPLQPFNRAYYDGIRQSRLFSFNEQWLPVLNERGEKESQPNIEPLPSLEQSIESLSLEELARFLRHPARYFAQHRFKAFFTRYEEEEQEDEPFAIDGLSAFHLSNNLLSAMLDKNEDVFLQRLALQGDLPYGAFGRLELEANKKVAKALVSALESFMFETLDPIEVNLEIEGVHLQSWLELPSKVNRVSYRVGRVTQNQLLELWIEHLALCAQGTPKNHYIVNLDPKTFKLDERQFVIISEQEARKLLANMLHMYRAGRDMPIPLPCDSAQVWCDHFAKGAEEDEETTAWEEALNHYKTPKFNKACEAEDPFWQRFFPNLEDYQDTFETWCQLIWRPLFQHLEKVDDK
ncbi:exodeoxyribonuclease V subunit gamma [Marinomonas epiphytica]